MPEQNGKRRTAPDTEEILSQLRRITSAERFARSGRGAAFLTFAVEKYLEGKTSDLKGYVIGVEVFGKPDGFDPDSDATVRVEAGRLRKALSLYYYEEGKNDPVIIDIPKGTYAPVIRYNDTLEQPSEEAATAASATDIRKKRIPPHICRYISPALLCLAGGAALFAALYGQTPFFRSPGGRAGDAPPVLAATRFTGEGGESAAQTAASLRESVIAALSRFDTLDVIEAPGMSRDGISFDISAIEAAGADYVLTGSVIERLDEGKARIRLFDTEKGVYIRSKTVTYDAGLPAPEAVKEAAALIASDIASPYGALHQAGYERVAGGEEDDRACILRFYAYLNRHTEDGRKHVLNCIKRRLKATPGNPALLAYLTRIYSDDIRRGQAESGGEKTKKRMAETARKALKADGGHPRVRQYAAGAAALAGDTEGALRHMGLALELNPFDTDIMADAARLYGHAGYWKKARIYGEKSVAYNDGSPRRYHGILFAYYYRAGDYAAALRHAQEYYIPDDLFSVLALAAAYAGMNKEDEAEKLARAITRKYPAFVADPRRFARAWRYPEDFTGKLLIGAEIAGIVFGDAY